MAKKTNDFSASIIEAAARIAKSVSARALMAYADAVPELDKLGASLKSPTELIVVVRDERDAVRIKERGFKHFAVPGFNLTRMGQIKMATLIAFSQGLLGPSDVFVFLTGVSGHALDTLVVMEVGQEYELFQSVDQPRLTEHIKRVVFQRALTLMLELANEGREGKSVGACFVIGDYREVQKYCRQNIINPFKGYAEKERNILDDAMRETIKEFSSIDGAFVIKGNGVITSAGTTLSATLAGDPLPQGLGARHAAAAAITAATKSIAMTVSESTGTIRLWRRGKMITEIEKAPRIPEAPPTLRNTEPSRDS
ncbi:MAG: DNA integrity scanning protein DisA nucleotide-binding domain protein [Planctomycetes bacterium]|nr:DNA integrity scanning protein DisA nucleotide-binding domain protein [Planctomycetota bacterium]